MKQSTIYFWTDSENTTFSVSSWDLKIQPTESFVLCHEKEAEIDFSTVPPQENYPAVRGDIWERQIVFWFKIGISRVTVLLLLCLTCELPLSDRLAVYRKKAIKAEIDAYF